MALAEITFAAAIGILTVVVSGLLKIIGFPDQFRINRKRQSTEGITTIFYVLALVSYFLWTIHGFLRSDWVIIIGHGIGIITGGAIVIQIIMYRKKR